MKCVTFDGLGAHLFHDVRFDESGAKKAHPLNDPRFAGASILLTNANFGCGSSREHAPQAIRRFGIRAVIGESFSEIFFGNSVALGMPCVTAAGSTLAALMQLVEADPSAPLVIDLEDVRVPAAGASHEITLPSAARESFLDGSWD